MFNKRQIEYMEQLGIKCNFERLRDDDLVVIEDVVGEKLRISGFDKNYNLTEDGKMCEGILDLCYGY
jgi:hypothetical protein